MLTIPSPIFAENIKKHITHIMKTICFSKFTSTLLTLALLLAHSTNVHSVGYNIAPKAKVSASSELESFPASNVTDGILRLSDKNEWRSQSGQTSWGQIDYPSIKLEWDDVQTISRVILYDRPSLESHVAGVTLHFSDSTRIFVNSIANSGAPKVVDFAPKQVDWLKVEVTDADGYNVGFSEIEVFTSIGGTDDCVGKVNPYIESARGRYFFFATGSLPFGMISAAPMTRNKNQYGGGYNYNSYEVLGFPQLHDWMISGVSLMPTSGTVSTSHGEQGWKSRFSHDGEIVRPGYHRLYLDRYDILVEQTATDRVSMYRNTYCADHGTSDILLNLGGFIGTTTMVDAEVSKRSDTEICGSFYTVGRLWGGPDRIKVYFTACFNRPMKRMDIWQDDREQKDIGTYRFSTQAVKRNPDEFFSYYDAPCCGARACFDSSEGDSLLVKIAVSYVSEENARQNMAAECGHWDFNRVKSDAEKTWNDYLSRIMVKGGTDDQQEKFYTDLWHVLLGRHKIDDFNGDYPDYTQGGERQGAFTKNAVFRKQTLPKDRNGKARFHMYNSDSFWLTQWNLNVLWGLAWPEVLDDFAASLVQYAENGYLLPRGPNIGGYSYIMTACPATSLITSAFQKNMLTKKSVQTAYRVMKNNHKGGGMLGTVEEIDFYEQNGYIPGNAGITLEAAFQDWTLSQMALKLGKKKDAEYYKKRSEGWKTLFHPNLKLIMPKDEKGNWLHEDPLNGWGWVEANAWQATWSVSHNLKELAELMGGTDTMAKMLDYAFEMSKEKDFVFGYADGYVSYANQPGLSNAHVFNRIGRGDLAQYWVRRVNEQAYGATTPDRGYGGHDEDQGQMGGVSALMSIGLFSVTGTSSADPVYDITSPVFDEIRIQLSPSYYKGKELVIRTENNSADNYLILSADFNGKEIKDFMIRHEELASGGVLNIKLGNKF